MSKSRLWHCQSAYVFVCRGIVDYILLSTFRKTHNGLAFQRQDWRIHFLLHTQSLLICTHRYQPLSLAQFNILYRYITMYLTFDATVQMCIANTYQDECIEFIGLFELMFFFFLLLISNVDDGDDDYLCTIFWCDYVHMCVRLHKKHDMLPPGRFDQHN